MTKMNTFYLNGDETVTYAVARGLKSLGLRQVKDVKSARVIFTYFVEEPLVEDAYFDSEGLVQLAVPDTFVVDLSPTSPRFAHELFAVASVSDLHFVSAPLVVVDQLAEEAFAPENLLVLAGGEEPTVELVRPLLESFAQVQVIGEAGQAQMARAAHTITQTSRLISTFEAEALYQAINGSSLDFSSKLSLDAAKLPADDVRTKALSAIAEKQFSGDYTTQMMMGEISAALTAADDVDLILPQLEAAMSLIGLLDVVCEEPLGPAGVSLLFAEEKAGKPYGLDWSRSRELFGQDEEGCGDDCDCDDDCDCGHHHGHAHAHGFADAYEEPYGFDRFGDEDEWEAFDEDEDDEGDEAESSSAEAR